jgi:decaprenyl-phosphate phosphoribosyltransferase
MPDAQATVSRRPATDTVLPHPIAAEPLPVPRRRGSTARAVLVTLRPRQWIKNVLVIAAAGAAGALAHDDVPVRVGFAFVAFCLLASGIYAINDVHDAAEDRLHPRKRFRPVAAGELDPRAAVTIGITLLIGGIALCAAVRPLLAVVGAAYALLTLSYTLVWRHLLVLDMVAIAGGFVLRAVAGGVAPPVELSRWFILVVTCAALFVAAGKRYAELSRLNLGAVALTGRRRVLEGYTVGRLRVIMLLSAIVAVVAYAVWALDMPVINGFPWRPLTIIPFAACVFRYGMLIAAGSGESPEDVLLSDRLLQLAGAAWLIVFALGVHAAA